MATVILPDPFNIEWGLHKLTLRSVTSLNCMRYHSSRKAKVMIAGGFDDIGEIGSFEFAHIMATSNAETEFAMVHEPTEMSRLATTT
jgi:hypothetical protein